MFSLINVLILTFVDVQCSLAPIFPNVLRVRPSICEALSVCILTLQREMLSARVLQIAYVEDNTPPNLNLKLDDRS
jgi:hypothetical protein